MTTSHPRPEGFLTVSKFTGDDGRLYTPDEAKAFGWVQHHPLIGPPPGWGIGDNELCLGFNLFTDAGRQLLAYCFGAQSPLTNYVVSKFGVGTGSTPPKVTDVELEHAVAFNGGGYQKSLDGITFPSPFIASAAFTLGGSDANGNLLTELGLYAGDGTLYARRVLAVGINKSSEFSPSLSWRIRF